MRDEGGFMRVYWSGAWYFLVADVRLRQQSGGKLTLDQALEKLNHCCADAKLSVAEIVDKLDQLNSVLLFRPLYQQTRRSTEMPAFDSLFASLGIAVVDGDVVLQQHGPGAALRKQILRPLVL
jgi:predicted metalloprotease with PDZ domain